MIIIAQISHIIRVMVYTFLTPETVWWVLAVEPLHGVTFACMWAAAIHYAAEISPKGLEATTQGILAGVFSGLGFGLGGITGGFVYQNFGPIVLYRSGAIIVFVAMILYILSIYCLPDDNHEEYVVTDISENGLASIDLKEQTSSSSSQ